MQKNEATAEELWVRYAARRDNEHKNALVVHYLPLVKTIVHRMLPAQQAHNYFDDLIHCGVLGLMDAIERFDPSRDVKFETYAYMRIRGEIIDNMRKQDWAPSNLRRQISQVARAYDELEMSLGRTATDGEVAEHLGLDVREVEQVLEKSHRFNMLYFEDMLSEKYASSESLQDTHFSPEDHLERSEMKQILSQIIIGLPEKERLVITLYYYEELPFKNIAEILGVSVSRVSQIHSKMLLKLRSSVQQYVNS